MNSKSISQHWKTNKTDENLISIKWHIQRKQVLALPTKWQVLSWLRFSGIRRRQKLLQEYQLSSNQNQRKMIEIICKENRETKKGGTHITIYPHYACIINTTWSSGPFPISKQIQRNSKTSQKRQNNCPKEPNNVCAWDVWRHQDSASWKRCTERQQISGE